ncbi:MAG: glutathione S-transferase, partial [Pseudomonadota bacterium]
MTYTLAIGDRTYSSWSLRGWLLFAAFGLDVRVVTARMRTEAFGEMLEQFGAAHLVPAMRIDEDGAVYPVWDTLAMAETLVERHPEIPFWPADPAARALARSIVAEMHSGFTALRAACPMNLARAYTGFAATDAVRTDVARVEALWTLARDHAGAGPWLFGAYSVADAFYAPVATRIATYDLEVGPEASAYVDTVLADPVFRRWRAMAFAENYAQPGYDHDLPERAWPGPEALSARVVEAGTPVNA